MARSSVRLFLDQSLSQGQRVSLTRDQAHYLFAVMRLGLGDKIEVFNGRSGAWIAEISQAQKRGGAVTPLSQSAPQSTPPDLWLLFAPIKKARTDFIVEKATEMGARVIQPVQTHHTNAERIRQDRLQAHAIEAAEQCGGTFVPEVRGMMRLGLLLSAWPEDRQLIFCDEGRVGAATQTLHMKSPAAILIGPEGGFSAEERGQIISMRAALPIALGPRILRADTAAVAALTLWQIGRGDWR